MDKRDTTRRGHLRYYLRDAKVRAKRKGLPFDLDLDHLDSIAVERCPVFGTEFKFGLTGRGLQPDSPSLDRRVPALGYVKENVAFISHRANTIKHDATVEELTKVLEWMKI